MTFSIVGVDRQAKEVGFAIASCSWDAGQVCFAEAGRGAIASQAKGNLAFLSQYFDLLEQGMDLEEILGSFRTSDEAIETRQIGLVSLEHPPVAFTGGECSPWCGHSTGEDYACQGNILVGKSVITDMAMAFESADGSLFSRLYAALKAGDDAGGDLRGRQSARLCVKKQGWGQPGTDTLIDIVIEDHDEPVKELGRILAVRRHLATILGLLGKLSKAPDEEKPSILNQLRDVLKNKTEPRYLDWWETLADKYYEMGDIDNAVDAYKQYLAINPALRTLLEAEAKAGRLSYEIAERVLD
jgi:uncharacterized Ntn-hydrolase superfamily protein